MMVASPTKARRVLPPPPWHVAVPSAKTPPARISAVVVLAVNGVGLVIDPMDSWRWLKGGRGVPGIRV